MRKLCLLSAALSLILVLHVAPSLLAESTSAEELARELRKSDDRVLQLLSDRWYNLIQLQDWTDATGKFTVKAKYVSYNEDEKKVTLLAIKDRGDEQLEEEVVVPVEKLSIQCQSRVRRIFRLHPKLLGKMEEVAAAEEEEEEEDVTRNQPYGEVYGTRGAEVPPSRPPQPRDRRDPRVADPSVSDTESNIYADADSLRNGEGRSVENPYGGTRFLNRDQLVEDRRILSSDPRTGRNSAPAAPSPAISPPEVRLTSDYVTEVLYEPAEFPHDKDESWQAFDPPWGVGSSLYARLMPAQPIAGQPAKLQVTAGTASVYGSWKPTIWARLGEPGDNSGFIDDDSGAAWVELPWIGGMIMDRRSQQMVGLDGNAERVNAGQPGESHYQIGLLLPLGNSAIQFKLEHAFGQEGPVALHGLNVSAVPGAVTPTNLTNAIR